MGPLFLVNWHSVHIRFRGLMWLVALVLAIVIVVHVAPRSGSAAHPVRVGTGHVFKMHGKP